MKLAEEEFNFKGRGCKLSACMNKKTGLDRRQFSMLIVV